MGNLKTQRWLTLTTEDESSGFGIYLERGDATFLVADAHKREDAEQIVAALNRNAALEASHAELVDALEFYAKEKSWQEQYQHHPYGSTTAAEPMGRMVDEDEGDIARAALANAAKIGGSK